MSAAVARRSVLGTSLIEAVVALAVMAFGMLAVVGIQSTLRMNADVAKQRSEAVRIAQESMEAARGFGAIEAPGAGQTAYADIATGTGQVDGYTTNTTFTLSRTVVAHDAPGRKEINILVGWTDRNGEAQSVQLNSIIAANDPRVALLLAARPNGIPLRQPLGRNPAIPVGARDMQDGTSAFKPPGAGDAVLWVFNNQTGVIVGVCNTVITGQAALTQADTQACDASTPDSGVQLSGFVRFATDNPPSGATRHSAAVAENPPPPHNTAFNLGVVLTNLSSAGNANPSYVCYTDAPSSYETTQTEVAYRCAILFVADAPLVWSAIAELTEQPFLYNLPTGYTPWAVAVDAADARASRYRICRYTPANSDADSIPNRQHPRQYTNVKATEPLTNQNFLVIRAGDGPDDGSTGTAFTCPTDVPIDPAAGNLVNSNTLLHQPAPV